MSEDAPLNTVPDSANSGANTISIAAGDIPANDIATRILADHVLAETIPQIVWTAEPDGALDYYNGRWYEYTGLSFEETRGWGWTPVLHHDDLQNCIERWTHCVSTGEVYEVEYRFRRASDNTYRWHLGRAVPVRDNSGRIVKWIGTCTDIEDRKHAEEQLRLSEERYHSLANATSQIIWIADENGVVDDMPSWRAYTGQSTEEVRGWGWLDAIHPDDRERTGETWTRAVESRSLYETEYLLRGKDGHYRFFLARGVPVLEENGEIREWVGTCTDITEQKQSEEAVKWAYAELERRVEERTAELSRANRELAEEIEQRKKFEKVLAGMAEKERALVEKALDIICSIDAEGNFVDINEACFHTWGYYPDELIGRRYIDCVAPEDVEKTNQVSARIIAGEKVKDFENRYQHRNGSLVDMMWSAYWSSSQELMFCVARDMTQYKEIDRLKSEFVSVVSHELRTPLTSIRGSLGLVAGGVVGELPPKARAMIDIAYKNSERLVRLINDILDIEKIASGQMSLELKEVDLISLVRNTMESNRNYAENYDVKFEFEPKIQAPRACVRADSDRLTQVLTNLLSNGAKFSNAGGVVRVTLQEDGADYRVCVADQGKGIPEDFRERIFGRFAQADSSDTRQKGGTGLGLSISKAIVEKLGGKIGFESKTGVGTTFYFSLPAIK